MNNVVKGIIVTVIVLVLLIVVNVICNINGINLDTTVTGTTSAICAMYIYEKIADKKKSE
jgi:FtsH-binding integral membrane protein